MTFVTLLLLFALASGQGAQFDDLAAELDQIARVASVLVDGDVCRRIPTARSMKYILEDHPRDRWFAADNYDVDHDAFVQTKKTLIRLSQLTEMPCDVNLWMPIETTPQRIHIVIRNAREMSQFWAWGALHQEIFPEMQSVLESGERVRVQKKPGMISVLAPVRDSLGDIVGLVEVVGRLEVDPTENVK